MKGEGFMPRKKKERGRPVRGYPPRIDATPEQLAEVLLRAGRPTKPVDDSRVYRCVDCKRAVYYPETLYNDGRCPECHATWTA